MPAPERKKSKQGAAKATGKKAVAAKPTVKREAAAKAPAGKPPARPAAAKPAAVKKVVAAKKTAPKTAPAKVAPKTAPVKVASKTAPAKVAPTKAAAKVAARPAAPKVKAPARQAAPKRKPAAPVQATRRDGPDPEGFFVARVRGEDAVRDAPHQLLEPGGWEEDPVPLPLDQEGLGELPWTYGDDLLVALPRDPRTLFVYWDHARATLEASFANLPGARVELWIFARGGAGWDRVRVVDVALEARGWYVHDLEPGRPYRAELHLVGSDGQDRMLPGRSVATALPAQGPSPVIDDRYASLPWGVPLPKLMGPGIPGGPFSEEARALLASLSGWSRFGHSRADGGDGSADPATPAGGPSSPTRPTSPGGPAGRKGA
jgi:hypothetical protein